MSTTTTQNFFANTDPSQTSRIYNSSRFNDEIVNLLKQQYDEIGSWPSRGITKLCNIHSREIVNKISPSPTGYNQDVYSISGLSYDEYIQATKLKDMSKTNPNLFDTLYYYKQRFDGVAFQSLPEYSKLDNLRFDADPNDIISQELQIYHQLDTLNLDKFVTDPNTCVVFESRHLLKVAQITQSSVSQSANTQPNENMEEEDDVEDDAEIDYTQKIYEYESSLSDGNYTGWSSGTQAQSLRHWYKPLGSTTLHDKQKLNALFYGYIRQESNGNHSLYHFDNDNGLFGIIPDVLIQQFIFFTYGAVCTIESMIRLCIENMKEGESKMVFKHYEAQFREKDMQILEVNDSKVPNCVINSKLNLFMILNSIHSMHNFINTLTFLYIKYHDIIMIYAYITATNGKSYGIRITPDNLITTIQQIFPNTTINVDDTSLIKSFESARDPTLEQYQKVLFKQEIKAEPSLLNSFHKEIKDIIDDCNANRGQDDNYYKWLVLEDILAIFGHGGVDKEYFIDGNNRTRFIQLLQENDIETGVGDIFWYRLGGVAGNNGNVHVIEEKMDDIESELDADLCMIQQIHQRGNETIDRDPDEEDQEKQEELDELTKGNEDIKNAFDEDGYFGMEYPLWPEYQNNDDNNQEYRQTDDGLDIQQHLMTFWISNNKAIDDLDGYSHGNEEDDDEDDEEEGDEWNGFRFPPDH